MICREGLEAIERIPNSIDQSTLLRLLPQVDVDDVVANLTGQRRSTTCVPQPLPCDHTSPYRTISGWCNNVEFPSYGNAFNGFRRLLEPDYDDGKVCKNLESASPRNKSAWSMLLYTHIICDETFAGFDEPRSMDHTRTKKLPSARAVSNAVHDAHNASHVKYTHMLMQFAQFLDHDTTHSPITPGP
jgi:hypothetical protein